MIPSSTPRVRIATFLVLTLALSSVFYRLLLTGGGLEERGAQLYVAGLMWSPGIAALVTQLAFHRSLRGLGWRWGGTRYQVAGYLLPLVYASGVYLTVWLLGLGAVNDEVLSRAAERFGIGSWPAPLAFVGVLVSVGLLGIVPNSLLALGEELGWRGFLAPELARSLGFTASALVVGSIWALWHYPLILIGGYRSGAPVGYGLVCFTIMVIGVSFPLAWLRLRSGSVWTAMLLHASHNLFVQSFYDRLTSDTGPTEWITGEFGAGLAGAGALVGYLYWRRRLKLVTSPSPSAAET